MASCHLVVLQMDELIVTMADRVPVNARCMLD